LLSNYSTFTFPAQFLISKIQRNLRLGTEAELFAENETLFMDYEPDTMDVPRHVIYVSFKAISCYYSGKYDESARLINNLLNEVSLKKYPFTLLELKSLLALQYVLMREYDLFNQLANSIQRQVRMFSKSVCENILLFNKILKIAVSEAKRDKEKKINAVIPKLQALNPPYFAPTLMIRLDDKLVRSLV
ncbi:MAG: hypothetical protein MUC73_13275, partial [Cyclobacteriaceae bacterium]|nr:hypothetical protein [Cyclobacteriaceae bacterium]